MVARSRIGRDVRIALGMLALAAGLAGPVSAGASDWPVAGEPDTQRDLPGVERNGTLRVVRFTTDGKSPVEDQETVLGWTTAAIDGTLVERRDDEPTAEEALLEIVKEKPTPLK